jgi:hypothetical protein
MKPRRVDNFVSDNLGIVYNLDKRDYLGNEMGIIKIDDAIHGRLQPGQSLRSYLETYFETMSNN